jgi:hypothetical protein
VTVIGFVSHGVEALIFFQLLALHADFLESKLDVHASVCAAQALPYCSITA